REPNENLITCSSVLKTLMRPHPVSRSPSEVSGRIRAGSMTLPGVLQFLLRGGPRTPVVYRNRVLPKILLLCGRAAGRNVALRHTKRLTVAGKQITVRPIAAEENTVLSE